MSRPSTPLALPVLTWGIFGGLAASMFCFCWVVSVPAGWGAVRWASRVRPGLRGGTAVSIGLGTGLILGMVTASFGTVMFLKSLDPQALQESAEMTSAFLGEDTEVSAKAAALGHAFMAFWANLFFGVLGGLLGAAGLSKEPPAPPAPPKYRFEPRQPIAPPPAEPTPDEFGRDEVPIDEVPSEAFQSAWRSVAEGGTPLQAPKQAPPPTTDEHLDAVSDVDIARQTGEDAATIAVQSASDEDSATVAVRPAVAEDSATIAVRPAVAEDSATIAVRPAERDED